MRGRARALSPRRLIDRLRRTQNSGHVAASLRWTSGSLSLGRLGALEVRLAATADEVRQAQKLRYRVFYKEGSAVVSAAKLLARRDVDSFDTVCDHLLVIDHAAHDRRGRPMVVGTYRLLRQDIAQQHGGFYSAGEFDIDGLLAQQAGLRFLELGRSCVLPRYRNKRTVELLWHGIGAYLLEHRLDVMIGCASLDGTDADRLALPLSYLHHFARAPESWRARALPQLHVEMNRLPKQAIDPAAALRELPPLVKGYLRLGAFVGDGAVIDRQFRTIDVLIILPVAAIKARYIHHFQGANRRAA
jgi:putative hemolysin